MRIIAIFNINSSDSRLGEGIAYRGRSSGCCYCFHCCCRRRRVPRPRGVGKQFVNERLLFRGKVGSVVAAIIGGQWLLRRRQLAGHACKGVQSVKACQAGQLK